MVDKNNIVWNWIRQYPNVNKLYFNFGKAGNEDCKFIPIPSDACVKEYVDGAMLKYYTFAITWIKDFSDLQGCTENINDYTQVNEFMDWIRNQNKLRNFPDFGQNLRVENIKSLQDMPYTENNGNQLAKYMFNVRITYMDYTEAI